ncbi:hypothetical protein TeGR_g3996 [Tetraparma gracilis]|uniref:Uncharacterized protein n=1 Tax=Tetraparma gracilis TaxID=2962635 RepID=A0ABQ6MMQ5_9STRA|nr:hypothetical protein TeGR_g3996 [Tetraparma gracilis]
MKRSLLPWRFSLHHLDSHPDLSCPSFPARSAPGDMYRLLDGSQSGIAEWIVPLAFHGHVGRVTWLRQAFAGGALARGEASVLVGEAGGLMRAAVRGDEMGEPGGCQFDAARYFLDDGALVREGELGGARPLEIEVLEPGVDPAPEIEGPFVLDVCLDYFCCLSPFLPPTVPPALIPNLELPHSPASFSPAARAASLAVFDAHLGELFGRAGGPPAAVTVARSAEDGFCTPEAGDELQGAVVEIVGRRVRERWGRELEITLDEGVKVGATRELTPG